MNKDGAQRGCQPQAPSRRGASAATRPPRSHSRGQTRAADSAPLAIAMAGRPATAFASEARQPRARPCFGYPVRRISAHARIPRQTRPRMNRAASSRPRRRNWPSCHASAIPKRPGAVAGFFPPRRNDKEHGCKQQPLARIGVEIAKERPQRRDDKQRTSYIGLVDPIQQRILRAGKPEERIEHAPKQRDSMPVRRCFCRAIRLKNRSRHRHIAIWNAAQMSRKGARPRGPKAQYSSHQASKSQRPVISDARMRPRARPPTSRLPRGIRAACRFGIIPFSSSGIAPPNLGRSPTSKLSCRP